MIASLVAVSAVMNCAAAMKIIMKRMVVVCAILTGMAGTRSTEVMRIAGKGSRNGSNERIRHSSHIHVCCVFIVPVSGWELGVRCI